MGVPLERTQVSDRATNRNFQRIGDFLLRLAQTPFADGVLLSDVTINGATSVKHMLGRLPRGWLEIAPGAASRIYETRASRTDEVLVLNSAASVTSDFWVF